MTFIKESESVDSYVARVTMTGVTSKDGVDGSLIVYGLPTGASYTVTEEADSAGISGYSLVTTYEINKETGNTVTTGSGSDAVTQATVAVTNTYSQDTVSLTIVKIIKGLDREHVAGLISGEYRTDGGLKFDVDYFNSREGASKDDYENKHVFIGDWTFSAEQTLAEDSSNFVENGSWEGDIRSGGEDIMMDEENGADHYGSSSLEEIREGDETYYKYTVTISDINPNDWYHVWETHVDVKNYDLSSSVTTTAESPINTNHPNRATAFQLTADTTVTFTNTYTPLADITVTKVDADTIEQETPAGLAGATFYLTRTIEESEGQTTTTYYKYDNESDTTSWVTKNENPTPLTSGSDGTFHIYNLEDGIYTLIETQAPDGYQLPEQDITITVNKGVLQTVTGGVTGGVNAQIGEGNSITVPNKTGAVLPNTGGAGTTMNTIGGLILMTAAAGGGYGLRRRRGKGDK